MYTQEYLESVEKAICDLQSGKRVTEISYGDTRVQYASLNLEDLLKLRSQIKSGLAESNPRKRQVIFPHRRGCNEHLSFYS